MSSATWLPAFQAALPASATTRGADRAGVEAALVLAIERGVAACPELDPLAFARYLASRCDGDMLDHLEAIDAVELAQVWACAGGDAVAIARFERAYFSELRLGAARLRCTADELDEVAQEVRRMLFADAPPRILALTARGDLRALLRLMALRSAISARRKAGRAPVADDDLDLLDDSDSPMTAVAKQQHRDAFRAALTAALAALPPRDRTILRMHALDGVPLAALATMHRVDRATISRWLAAARESIYRETRRALGAQRGIAHADFDSFIDLLRSRFEVSLRAALA